MSKYYTKRHLNSTNVRLGVIQQKVVFGILRLLWYLSSELADRLILRLFFAPMRRAESAEEKACMDRAQPFRVRVHNNTIQAWKWGQGPGVLLVHGWNGGGAQFHRFISPLINAGFAAIAFDGPAHGASSGRITSYFEFTDVVRAFLSPDLELNIQGIIAHSFGAAAAVNSLDKDRLSIATICIAPILRLRETILQAFQQFGIPQEIYSRLIRHFEKQYPYNLIQDNPFNLMSRLVIPVLVVHDTDDRAVPLRDAQEISRKNKHIALQTTQGLGHLRILSSEAVINACLEYLQTSPLRKLTA